MLKIKLEHVEYDYTHYLEADNHYEAENKVIEWLDSNGYFIDDFNITIE